MTMMMMMITTTTTTTIIIIAVISIVPYLSDKGEHTSLYKINNNACIKTSTIINYIVIIMIAFLAHT